MAHAQQNGRYHHGDLVNALLESAEALLEQRGAAGLSLRAVARSAGVSHAAPYRHFRDRSALLRALARRGAERLRQAMTQASSRAAGNPEQQLVEAGVAYVQLAVRQPELFRLQFGVPHGDEAGGASGPVARVPLQAFEEITRNGIASGMFRQRDAGELALTAWSALHGLALLAVAGQLPAAAGQDPGALEELVRSVARNVMYGLSR